MKWFFVFCCLFGFLCAEEFWGYHLILDCKGCEVEQIDDAKVLQAFVRDLVDEIDMKAYGEPLIEYFAVDNPKAAGYSLVQLIETSAITGHFASVNGDSYIDIFSCKFFDIDKAKAVVQKYLKPEKVRTLFLCRQA